MESPAGQKAQGGGVPLADVKAPSKASRHDADVDWHTRYPVGTFGRGLQLATVLIMAKADIQNALKAKLHFDAKIFPETVKA